MILIKKVSRINTNQWCDDFLKVSWSYLDFWVRYGQKSSKSWNRHKPFFFREFSVNPWIDDFLSVNPWYGYLPWSVKQQKIYSVKRDLVKNLPWIRDTESSVIRETAKIYSMKRDLVEFLQWIRVYRVLKFYCILIWILMCNLSFINRLLACQGMSQVATETLTHTDTDT